MGCLQGADMSSKLRSGAFTRLSLKTDCKQAKQRKWAQRRRAWLATLVVCTLTGTGLVASPAAAVVTVGSAQLDQRHLPVDGEEDLVFKITNPTGASTINWIKIVPGGAGVKLVADGASEGWVSSVSGTNMIYSGGSLPGGQSREFVLTVVNWPRSADGVVTWTVLASDNGGASTISEPEAFPGALALDVHALGVNSLDVASPDGAIDGRGTQGETITIKSTVSNFGGMAVNYYPLLSSSDASDQVSTFGSQTRSATSRRPRC